MNTDSVRESATSYVFRFLVYLDPLVQCKYLRIFLISLASGQEIKTTRYDAPIAMF